MLLALPYVVGAQERVVVDLEVGWLHRDWAQCRSGGHWAVADNAVRFSAAGAAVLYIAVARDIAPSDGKVVLRDLYTDYIRAFPREKPGYIGRIYVKLPKSGRKDSSAVEFTYLHFMREGNRASMAGED